MYQIDHRTYDSICMVAKGLDDAGRHVDVSLTYAFGGLSVYDKTNQKWVGEWRWTNMV